MPVRASVIERCNHEIHHTAITNLSLMLGSESTVRLTLVYGARRGAQRSTVRNILADPLLEVLPADIE